MSGRSKLVRFACLAIALLMSASVIIPLIIQLTF